VPLARSKLRWLDISVKALPQPQLFRDVLGVQRSGPTKAVQEKKSNEQGDRVMGGQGSMMHAGSSSWPMLSDSTEESL